MDDILASIRKIIADDFSISGGTKSYNSEERLGGDPSDDGENSDSDVLDLGKPSPLVHSLSGASSRQVESDIPLPACWLLEDSPRVSCHFFTELP